MTAPLPFRWTGEAMEPLRNYARRADEQFVVGQTYVLALQEDRSAATHRHYFACINEVWKNLPEGLERQFPTAEHLRKMALILTGYRDEREIVCASKAEAQRVAAFVRPMDGYALVTVTGATVRVFTAKSQSVKAMGKAEFQASKDAVLERLADVLQVTVPELMAAAA